ncbi:MAG: zinc-dependent metalloprotease, partial [Candidatus Hinthialibacter sp.]
AMIGLTVMAARAGIENVTGEELDDFISQYLFSVVCHEFGHVLGLRHNFEASTMLPVDQLHNKELTAQKSFTSSIMDYTPVNIAPEGVEQGYYYPPTIGPYDYLAIEYAYKEIKPATGETEEDLLNAIAEKAETAELTYGTDEDLYSTSPYSGSGIDPLCNQFDLGREPLNYAKQQTQMVLDTIPKLPELVKDGDSYLMVRNAFSRLLNYYFESADFAIKYLGGQYVNRVKKGGENDRPPLEPVSAARQREAVNFLVETIFDDDLFEVNPEILNMLAAEKWYHWGANWPGPTSEYPLSVVVQNLYKSVLSQTYSPMVIRRILDADQQRPEGEVDFTLPELFRRIKQGVWNEVYQRKSDAVYTNDKPFISTYQRILQREHLKMMIEIMLDPVFGMPDDARTQAWRTLADLKQQLSEIIQPIESSHAIDDYSRDHLAESLEKINRALDARLSAGVDLW